MTTATATRPRRRKTASVEDIPVEELRHYSVKETAALLGISPRWLAGKCAAREVAFTVIAGQNKFTAAHIRLLSAAGEVVPAAIGRRVLAPAV
ncbi:hypothetical protein [Streptomyces sp. NRRL B-24484]|uniref:hypothetical protein n=1 Tax=Streptomyces sp. NRRL B-24484 TaxID=1463833 RepID=UPI0004C23282|nr:hypothetical protein [Streptomyces sp. NRRL B-24484]